MFFLIMELISESLKRKIESHPEVDWAFLLNNAIAKMLRKIELAEFLESKLDASEFTEEDANRLGELAKQNRLKELKSKGFL